MAVSFHTWAEQNLTIDDRECYTLNDCIQYGAYWRKLYQSSWPQSVETLSRFVNMTHIFWDFHGVLLPLRGLPERTWLNEDEYLKLFFRSKTNPMEFRDPPVSIRYLSEALESETQYVLSMVTSNLEFDAEKEVIAKYYPMIPEDHIIGVSKADYKVLVMQELVPAGNEKRAVLVDDTIGTLKQVEDAGFWAYHTSYVMN